MMALLDCIAFLDRLSMLIVIVVCFNMISCALNCMPRTDRFVSLTDRPTYGTDRSDYELWPSFVKG